MALWWGIGVFVAMAPALADGPERADAWSFGVSGFSLFTRDRAEVQRLLKSLRRQHQEETFEETVEITLARLPEDETADARNAEDANKEAGRFVRGARDSDLKVEESESVIFRIDADRSVALALGDLRVWADQEVVRAEYIGNGVAIFEVEHDEPSPADAIRDALPPLPLPQLAFASRAGKPLRHPTPYSRDVVWEEARWSSIVHLRRSMPPKDEQEREDFKRWLLSQRAMKTIIGRFDGGEIKMLIDHRDRFRRTNVEFDSGRMIQVRVTERSDSVDPTRWKIETSGRRRVDSLTALAPKQGEIASGDSAPDLLLLTLDGQLWRPSQSDNRATALVFFRRDHEAARSGENAARLAADRVDGLRVRAAAVFEPDADRLMDRRDELADAWGDDLLWTVSPKTTIERFAPSASAVVVVVDAKGVTRAVIPLDGRAGEDEAIAERIVASLKE